MRAKMTIAALAICLIMAGTAQAHFGMVIPQADTVERPGPMEVQFMFWHPMEGQGMELVKPAKAGVKAAGEDVDLLPALKEVKKDGHTTWQATYDIKKPGDYIFFMEPKPYWEPAEDCFIVHYTKAVVDALGAEEGWDEPLGTKMEIVPLTKPFGLYGGNAFTGQVLYKGKPLAGAEVEVEYYNKDGKREAPTGAHITQLVKTDGNGVFTYAMPWSGWWGFAALHTDEDRKIKQDGVDKDVEVGGVLWVYAHPSQP